MIKWQDMKTAPTSRYLVIEIQSARGVVKGRWDSRVWREEDGTIIINPTKWRNVYD